MLPPLSLQVTGRTLIADVQDTVPLPPLSLLTHNTMPVLDTQQHPGSLSVAAIRWVRR
jgi:hypothetical protein